MLLMFGRRRGSRSGSEKDSKRKSNPQFIRHLKVFPHQLMAEATTTGLLDLTPINDIRSALISSFRVVHMPCGTPLGILSCALLTILDDGERMYKVRIPLGTHDTRQD